MTDMGGDHNKLSHHVGQIGRPRRFLRVELIAQLRGLRLQLLLDASLSHAGHVLPDAGPSPSPSP
eukprot:COSAG01_NODE_27136_length_693_cov_1.215488_1_plen_64_part_10